MSWWPNGGGRGWSRGAGVLIEENVVGGWKKDSSGLAGQDALCVSWRGFAGTLFVAMDKEWLTHSEHSQVTDSCRGLL